MNRSISFLLLAAALFAAPALASEPDAPLAPTTPAAPVAASAANDLLPGDAAPKLEVAKWVKGSPVTAFEKGKVYIVEFWATWCGPCRTSIPHLTELAKKHKDKVVVTGISVWENGDEFAKTVEDFVAEQGDAMDYHVGRDNVPGNEGVMASTWMEAAGQGGIPAAFIVNGEGKIAWIGHPMEMDAKLDAVLAGTHDIAASRAAAQEQLKAGAKNRAMMKDYKLVAQAMEKKDHAAALAALNDFATKYPEVEEDIRMQRLMIQLQADPAQARTTVQDWMNGSMKDDAEGLNTLAWTILGSETPGQESIDLAMLLSRRSNELTKHEHPMYLDTLALATFKSGDVAKAVELQKKALTHVSALPFDPDSNKEVAKGMQAQLEMFEKKAK